MLRFILLCLLATMITAAPKRRKDGGATFDQKQTGEYNIQLHLKDFQIIAMVGDESFGGFGDYDYDYDYSDLTVKPSTSTTTTTKTPESSSSIPLVDSTTVKGTTSKKPGYTHPYPIISPSTTKKPIDLPPSTIKQDSSLLSTTISSISTATPTTLTSKTNATNSTPTIASTKPSTTVTITTTTTAKAIVPNHYSNVPGQIPVVVQDFTILRDDKPLVKDKEKDNKKIDGVTSVTIVPLDDSASVQDLASDDQLTLGEIMHYRRCAQGYQRDKRGRCRKVRRPQIPLGITRFASNLAARFRQTGSTTVGNREEANIE